MPGVALKVGALVVLGFVCACGSEFMAGGASGGGGGDGGTSASGGSAGSAKGGSKAGGSSSAGSNVGGGSGACVPGGACAADGSSCTSSDCCPCVYQCSSGRWEQTGCAACAPARCPPEPPSDGQACSQCEDPVGEPCSWDRCETSLERYTGTCDGSTWQLSVEPCGGGNGCCSGDEDCPSMICVNNVCKEPIVDGCWRDHECGPDTVCSGASVCSCGVECFAPDSPGVCVPADLGCCSDGAPCLDSSQRCVAGVCREAPPQGQCWSDADCPGGVCKESNSCSCGGTCTGIEYPGTCG